VNLKGVSPYVCILSGYFYLGLPSFQISLLRPEFPSLPSGSTRLLVSPSLHSYALLVSTSHSSHRASTSSTEILFVLLPTSSALPPRYSPSHLLTKLFPPFSNSLSLFLSSRCKYSTLLTSSLCLAVFLLKLYDKFLHLTSYSRPSWYNTSLARLFHTDLLYSSCSSSRYCIPAVDVSFLIFLTSLYCPAGSHL
jgi:hypothetical protein